MPITQKESESLVNSARRGPDILIAMIAFLFGWAGFARSIANIPPAATCEGARDLGR